MLNLDATDSSVGTDDTTNQDLEHFDTSQGNQNPNNISNSAIVTTRDPFALATTSTNPNISLVEQERTTDLPPSQQLQQQPQGQVIYQQQRQIQVAFMMISPPSSEADDTHEPSWSHVHRDNEDDDDDDVEVVDDEDESIGDNGVLVIGPNDGSDEDSIGNNDGDDDDDVEVVEVDDSVDEQENNDNNNNNNNGEDGVLIIPPPSDGNDDDDDDEEMECLYDDAIKSYDEKESEAAVAAGSADEDARRRSKNDKGTRQGATTSASSRGGVDYHDDKDSAGVDTEERELLYATAMDLSLPGTDSLPSEIFSINDPRLSSSAVYDHNSNNSNNNSHPNSLSTVSTKGKIAGGKRSSNQQSKQQPKRRTSRCRESLTTTGQHAETFTPQAHHNFLSIPGYYRFVLPVLSVFLLFSVASNLYLLFQQSDINKSTVELRNELLVLRHKLDKPPPPIRPPPEETDWDQWNAGTNDDDEYDFFDATNFLNNCWVKAKANMKLGECVTDTKDRVASNVKQLKELSQSFSQSLWKKQMEWNKKLNVLAKDFTAKAAENFESVSKITGVEAQKLASRANKNLQDIARATEAAVTSIQKEIKQTLVDVKDGSKNGKADGNASSSSSSQGQGQEPPINKAVKNAATVVLSSVAFASLTSLLANDDTVKNFLNQAKDVVQNVFDSTGDETRTGTSDDL